MNRIRGERKNDEMYNPYLNGKVFLLIKGNEAI